MRAANGKRRSRKREAGSATASKNTGRRSSRSTGKLDLLSQILMGKGVYASMKPIGGDRVWESKKAKGRGAPTGSGGRRG